MILTDDERLELRALLGSESYDGSVSWRAQIVLWWDEGYSIKQIVAMAKTSDPTVRKWIRRYESEGVDGLVSRTSPGRPRGVSGSVRSRILALTKIGPPEETGLTHWSSREMAKYLKRHEGISVSHNFVADLWREHDIQPHRVGSFKVSSDPDFVAKVCDVVGLYLDPPSAAIVLSLDEKTQVQALERTQPMLPVGFGKSEKRTYNYLRHGTTNLFAALDIKTGKVTGSCFARRRTGEFLKFLDKVIGQYPREAQIHVVLDNLSTHNNPVVDAWLAAHPNVTFHFTPKGGSWLNQIETWFGIITRQAIRRGSFTSLSALTKRIERYIDHWNEDAEPFEWTATASEILAKVAVLDRDFRKLVANNT